MSKKRHWLIKPKEGYDVPSFVAPFYFHHTFEGRSFFEEAFLIEEHRDTSNLPKIIKEECSLIVKGFFRKLFFIKGDFGKCIKDKEYDCGACEVFWNGGKRYPETYWGSRGYNVQEVEKVENDSGKTLTLEEYEALLR